MPQVGIIGYLFVLLPAVMGYKPEPLAFDKLPEIFRSAENNLMTFAHELERNRQKGIHITAAAYGNNKNFHKNYFIRIPLKYFCQVYYIT